MAGGCGVATVAGPIAPATGSKCEARMPATDDAAFAGQQAFAPLKPPIG